MKNLTFNMPIVMNAFGSIRKYFHRVVTLDCCIVAPSSFSAPSAIITPGRPWPSASSKSATSMHATANGRESFCTWIAQLRSMSETDAPPKTRRSGSPAASRERIRTGAAPRR